MKSVVMMVLVYGNSLGAQVFHLLPRSKPRSPAQHKERDKKYLDVWRRRSIMGKVGDRSSPGEEIRERKRYKNLAVIE